MEVANPNVNPSEHHRNSIRIPRLVWIGAALVMLICGVLLFAKSRRTRPPLPDAEEIRSIEAHFYDPGKQSKVNFQVPREHWNAIFSALLPARRDASPAKWAGLGDLQLNLVNGESYYVSLYSVDGKSGAFSAGPTFESRVYYRGGNSSELKKSLVDAFNTTTDENR